MGHGKSKKVDKNVPTSNPQIENTNEVGPQSLSNVAVCCTGITGVGTVGVPLKVLPHFSTSCVGDMSLPGIDRMIGASERDSYQNFMGAKVDNSKAQSVGNFMCCSSRELSLGGAQDGKEMGSNDNLVDCVVQSDYPKTLDGRFLTLGVGSNTEARAKSSAPSRGSIGKNDGAIYTQIVQNAGESFDVSAFSGAVHNVDSFSPSEYNLEVSGSTSSNFGLSSSRMSPMPQTRVAHSLLKAVHGTGSILSGLPPNQGFQSLSNVSPIVHSNSQSGLNVHIPQRMAARPSLSSYMTSKYATTAFDQVQNSNMGSIPNFQRGTFVATPAPGSSVTTRNWYRSGGSR
ncbi:hypothetical protein CCACVL1_10079 [Corchorus capsularis]|uniref:Uncharacterized protein n=1 Tax=Corchorus capsularis TaxID=210143 RepID=A0A1R3ISR5_COCAP|nr:hypothetical protein CCACVL1_10079 [Corchorus capsularis]